MEKVELLVHDHPLLPFARFYDGRCGGCSSEGYIYGGYRCNELGCDTMFHKECAESKPEISHQSHPDHPLKLVMHIRHYFECRVCRAYMGVGYYCSICDRGLHLVCAKSPPLSLLPQPSAIENYKVHEHPLQPSKTRWLSRFHRECVNETPIRDSPTTFIAMGPMGPPLLEDILTPHAYHKSHPKHPLKYLKSGGPSYADEKCLLCGVKFLDERINRRNEELHQCQKDELYHCDVCNVSICMSCVKNPPPLAVVSPTTHEHRLHLIPRLLDFTCNACGTQGDRSPYFCLLCNFMIHRSCIDLPRIIHVNRHDHRISYICYLGHGNWKCGVCRKKVDGFYGAYSCLKCPSYAVHSLCATRKDVWDMVELEGTPEEEEIAPFEVVDENTIKHMSHDHDLILNKDGRILHERKLCEACVSQINSDPFYSCEQCSFILHETCANMPRIKRHVLCNIPFTLQTNDSKDSSRQIECSKDSSRQRKECSLCLQYFTGFGYKSGYDKVMDVRCGSICEPFVHESHPHPLYYKYCNYKCDACDSATSYKPHTVRHMLCCDECEFSLDFRCATLPTKIMKQRYDDHPLYLSYNDNTVDGEYWCDVCEKKVDGEIWFYTCDACGVTLHVSCIVGDLSYQMPGPISAPGGSYEMVADISICRPLCFVCHSRCKLAYMLSSHGGVDYYYCSEDCHKNPWKLLNYWGLSDY